MKTIHIVDKESNDYLRQMYLIPLAQFLQNKGIAVSQQNDENNIYDSIVIIHGDLLSPERILAIKNNRNLLVTFDINDSSYFSSAYHASGETALIDLFFKVSGIPKTNTTHDLSIDRNFAITTSEVRYLPDDEWTAFKAIKDAGKIKPLPYVLWRPISSPGSQRPANERSHKVLVRGGNHFWRFVLFLRLMQEGLDDDKCLFATDAYFHDSMIERFRYCSACIEEKMSTGKSSYDTIHDIQHCRSPVMWGAPGEFFGGPLFGRNEFGMYNNRCPASFFWLAKEYERCRGPLNKAALERALNGSMTDKFFGDLGQASYYADLKWLNTIYVPPRFWEAASLGTVNYYPERTGDQDYFPAMKRGVHYFTFVNDMRGFGLEIVDDAWWTEVSHNAKDLYETWIRGNEYAISTNLLQHILTCIEEIE